MNLKLQKANLSNVPKIWEILQKAILRRKADGSNQWQDGYPNESVIAQDIAKGIGYVLTDENKVSGYAVIQIPKSSKMILKKNKVLF